MTESHDFYGAWKIGVFFGSESDKEIAHQLTEPLRASGYDVDLHYISAHRNADELARQMKRDAYDLYIAGAGLAAHLPGVIASHTQRPVFGIPVDGAFGGLDALLAIVQMPGGVPVLSSGVEKTNAVVAFLAANSSYGCVGDQVHLSYPYLNAEIINTQDFKRELSRAIVLAEESGMRLTHGAAPVAGAINVVCVDLQQKTAAPLDPGAVLVPWLAGEQKKSAESALLLAGAMHSGGLWVGVNNLRNGILAASRIGKLRKAERLIYRGSVKNVLSQPNDKDLIFEYSDRYSVFDWGPMPDEIPGKGEALATIADQIFHHIFQTIDIPHHSLGLIPGRPRCLSVKKVDVKCPLRKNNIWDYSEYATRPVDSLVPLEVIFRFGIPVGSSLPGRLQANPEYMSALTLLDVPKVGDLFLDPIIEFSTKLEDCDRYLLPEEARRISGMSEAEMSRLRKIAGGLAVELQGFFARADLKLWDGKFEFAFAAGEPSRNFMLVDSIGPDELRLTHDGVQISKELLRQFYVDGPWHNAVGRAKEIAAQKSSLDWRALCAEDLGQSPPPLTAEVRRIAQNIYPAIANSLARVHGKRPPFPAAWDLSHLVACVREEGLA